MASSAPFASFGDFALLTQTMWRRVMELSRGAIAVLGELALMVRRPGQVVTIRLRRLAERIGYAPASVRRFLWELDRAGLVDKIPQFRDDGSQSANGYRILHEPADERESSGAWCGPDAELELPVAKPPEPEMPPRDDDERIAKAIEAASEPLDEERELEETIVAAAEGIAAQLREEEGHHIDPAAEVFRPTTYLSVWDEKLGRSRRVVMAEYLLACVRMNAAWCGVRDRAIMAAIRRWARARGAARIERP